MVEKTAPAPGRDRFVWDSKVPGFGVVVYPSGKRVYIFQYRIGGRQGRVKIGAQGAFTVEEARRVAAGMYQTVRQGRDPIAQKREARGAAVERVIEDFMTRHMKGKGRTLGYIYDTRGNFDRYVLPRWRARDLRSITRRDVIELLDRIVDEGKPATANSVLTSISKLFAWSVQRGLVASWRSRVW